MWPRDTGIAGNPLPVHPTQEWMNRLKNFMCQIYDEKGTMLIEAPGSNLMEHPMNVVL